MTFIILILSVCGFAWVAYRTWEVATDPRTGGGIEQDVALDQLLELANKKRLVLSSLQETELDHHTGKVADVDYAELKDHDMREGAELVRRLDDVRAELRYDDQIEHDVANLGGPLERRSGSRSRDPGGEILGPPNEPARNHPSPEALQRKQLAEGATPCPLCDELLEPEEKSCRSCGTDIERACPTCNTTLATSDRFCRECGTSLVA